MFIYPNQRIITIKKNATTENNAIILDYETTMKAMRDLKPATFLVWIYLNANENGCEFALSRVDVMNQTGISSSSYDSAIKELKEKSYLIHTTDNRYDFYATPTGGNEL